LTLLFWLVRDIVQKKHSVLRNYPLIGRLRYLHESEGEYIRQYFIAGERDEMPFNRAARNWVYRTAKGVGGVIGFGSTNDLREPGSIIFVNAPFPVLESEQLATPAVIIGEGHCREPCTARYGIRDQQGEFSKERAPGAGLCAGLSGHRRRQRCSTASAG
jgi:hypothetical protein